MVTFCRSLVHSMGWMHNICGSKVQYEFFVGRMHTFINIVSHFEAGQFTVLDILDAQCSIKKEVKVQFSGRIVILFFGGAGFLVSH